MVGVGCEAGFVPHKPARRCENYQGPRQAARFGWPGYRNPERVSTDGQGSYLRAIRIVLGRPGRTPNQRIQK